MENVQGVSVSPKVRFACGDQGALYDVRGRRSSLAPVYLPHQTPHIICCTLQNNLAKECRALPDWSRAYSATDTARNLDALPESAAKH